MTINYLNLKLFIFVYKFHFFIFLISKVQDFGNVQLSTLRYRSAYTSTQSDQCFC